MAGEFGAEVDQVIDRAVNVDHPGLPGADGFEVDQPIPTQGIPAQLVEGLDDLEVAGLAAGLFQVDEFREAGDLLVEAVQFAQAGRGSHGGEHPLMDGIVGFLVVKGADEAAEHDLGIFLAQIDLALEGRSVADRTVGADLTQETDESGGTAPAIDGRIHHEHVDEALATQVDAGAPAHGGLIFGADHTIGVADLGHLIDLRDAPGVLDTDDRFERVRHG